MTKDLNRSPTESAAEAEALFTSIGDGAITTDEFGRITRINPAAQALLGFGESDVIGHWFPKKIVAVTDQNTPVNLVDRPITKAFLTGKPSAAKMLYRHKDGHPVAVAVNVSPIVLNGKPLGAIEVFRDITADQEVDRMKSEFISLASHQLRTPLSAIKTYSHMLADGYMGKLNKTQKQSLATILSASNRMNELISTLLNITRIESGTIAVTRKLVSVDRLIHEILPELALMAEAKSITLSYNLQGEASPRLKTDPLLVKEIVMNLTSNAIKYTPDGGTVAITLKPRNDDVIIAVHDSGWGIPLEDQAQIFSKFFRAGNISRKETTGTGLGLYLVRGLLDALGGRIWFESTENVGTDFSVSLPRAVRSPKKGTERRV